MDKFRDDKKDEELEQGGYLDDDAQGFFRISVNSIDDIGIHGLISNWP